MTTPLYPLLLLPIYKHALWGGRRFESLLGRHLEAGNDYAESWEVCDHGEDQSRVGNGPLAGTELGWLVTHRNRELLGRNQGESRFPLLLKYLDAQKRLSVQVHPDDPMAARMGLSDPGKTEAWYILHAEPQSTIWAGFQRRVDPEILRRAIQEGALDDYLHRFTPMAGQCLLLRAGTVHALGEGLVVAEIQQNSDTTFRLFDWNRLDAAGKARTLHIDQALEVIDYRQGPLSPCEPVPDRTGAVQLAGCDKFVLKRHEIRDAATVGGEDRCHILTVLAGSIALDAAGESLLADRGQTLLVPADVGQVTLQCQGDEPAVLLEAFLP